jgi:hypothetical protein
MPAEHQSAQKEKPQAVKPTVTPQVDETQAVPVFQTPAKLHDLPPGLKRRNLPVLQRVVGNRAVQRILAHSVIQREGGGGGSSTPIPSLPDPEARRALALHVLKEAYGGLIKQELSVVTVEGLGALQSAYDQAMKRQGKTFKDEEGNETPWKEGDAARSKLINKDFAGFQDPSAQGGGSIVIDKSKKPDEQVATIAHEMLHANSSGEMLSVLGRGYDEGMTETLTKNAFEKAGYAYPGGFYPDEMGYVDKLSAIVGENTMKYAYFKGLASLRSMMDTVLDEEGIFDRFANNVRSRNWDFVDTFLERYQRAVQGSEVDKKIAAIVSLLEGWWVSDDDIANIENIWSGSSPEEQALIRREISARLLSLTDLGQRTRLRILIGS